MLRHTQNRYSTDLPENKVQGIAMATMRLRVPVAAAAAQTVAPKSPW